MKKTAKQLEDLYGFTIGGATLVKGTDVLAHAQSPAALTGDVQGLVGIGVAGSIGSVVMRQATRQLEPKRKRRRRNFYGKY